ncbi:MAG: DUF3429 domain-containing protein [Pseudomonadales bacterium]|jgi:hypothetical protein|nr:DUF3429 domain-containing protein [Pseudomonadales bacterium]
MRFFNQKQLAMSLIGLGAVPLVVGGLLVVTQTNLAFLPAASALMLHVYGVIVASLVAGVHWGIHFCKRTNDSVYLLSCLSALLLWLSFMWAGRAAGFALVLVSFVLLWVEEYRLSQQRVTTLWFWQLRNLVSAIAVVSLLLAIIGS